MLILPRKIIRQTAIMPPITVNSALFSGTIGALLHFPILIICNLSNVPGKKIWRVSIISLSHFFLILRKNEMARGNPWRCRCSDESPQTKFLLN